MKRIALLTVLMTLAFAAPASAKIWFSDMDGRRVAWDQRVVATISGCERSPDCGDFVHDRPVYLRAVGGGAMRLLARIDRRGRLRFAVPRVAPGRYRLISHEGGRRMHVSTAFRILRAR